MGRRSGGPCRWGRPRAGAEGVNAIPALPQPSRLRAGLAAGSPGALRLTPVLRTGAAIGWTEGGAGPAASGGGPWGPARLKGFSG